MRKRIFILPVCVVLLLAAVVLTACNNEKEEMQEQIDILERSNAELQSNIASMQNDLERSRTELSFVQSELFNTQQALEDARNQVLALQQGSQSGPLAITYGGSPNTDMSWPINFGELKLGLRVNLALLGEEDEIVWHSTNEDIFVVLAGEDGTTAVVTPLVVGSAQVVVTVGEQTTRSWVRITER